MKVVPRSLMAALLMTSLTGPVAAAQTSAAADPDTAAEGGILARVNDEPIYVEDAERQLSDLHSGMGRVERSAFDLDRLLTRLVNDTLLAQEARAMGMAEEPPVPGKLEDLRRKLAVARLQNEEIAGRVDVTDGEIREAFEREYRRVTLRVLTTHETAEAEVALAELEAGADFAELAAERSKDPYALRGGLVRSLPRIDLMREIAEVAFDLEPGALFGPVRTPLGYAVIRIEGFEPADPERFEAVRNDIGQMVYSRKSQRVQEDLAERLRERHRVTIDERILAGIVPDRIADGRLMPKVEDPAAAVARVGDREILAGEYADALKWRWKGVRNEEAAAVAAPLVLEKKIESLLLLVEARVRGYDASPAVERRVAALERDLLVERYLREVLGPMAGVEIGEMEAYYEANRDRFKQPPRLHLSQITVETEAEAGRLAALLQGGADVKWLARKHSIDRFKDAGGERGWTVPSPGTDDFNDRLLEAGAGDVLGPLGGPGNYRVIKVDIREEQGPYPFQEVSGNVRSILFSQRFGEVLDGYLEKLRSRSEIVVHRDALESMRITGVAREGSEPPSAHAH